MKVLIDRADFGDLLKDYPCLEKYRKWFTPKNSGDDDYWRENSIVKDMDNDELFSLIQELTSYSRIVIAYANIYEHNKYGIDFKITIYDFYLE